MRQHRTVTPGTIMPWVTRSLFMVAALFVAAAPTACDPTNPEPAPNGNDNASNQNDSGSGGTDLEPVWRTAFDTAATGALSSVWGSGADDVFVVGGTPEQGEIYHYDGDVWREMPVPAVPLLVWVFGFGPNNVIAVGEGGGAVHYDGEEWSLLDTGTQEDLWGVWGATSDDVWIVGGDVGDGDPVILRYDGSQFTSVPAPDNDRSATSLFKVFGVGGKVFAVGENGLIIEFVDEVWSQVSAGAEADDDFVALWGTSADNIVAVGGRSAALVARYDGSSWSTTRFRSDPGLNAVFMESSGETIVGGQNGFAAAYDVATGELSSEVTREIQCIHAIWGDDAGIVYSVGGRFTEPYTGIALTRRIGIPDTDSGGTGPPIEACEVDDDCLAGQICIDGGCVAGARCTSDEQCADGEVCMEELCVAVPGAPCQTEPDCALGEICSAETCKVTRNPDVQYLVSFGGDPEPLAEGGDIPVFRGGQGGNHTEVTLRVTGFNFGTEVELTIEMNLADGRTVVGPNTSSQLFEEIERGVGERQRIFTRFVGISEADLVGQDGVVTLTLSDTADRSLTAFLTQTIRFVEVE